MTKIIPIIGLGLAIVAIAAISAGCPDRETRPGRDDTSEPADGDTGGDACEEQLKALEADLAECRATAPK